MFKFLYDAISRIGFETSDCVLNFHINKSTLHYYCYRILYENNSNRRNQIFDFFLLFVRLILCFKKNTTYYGINNDFRRLK